MDEGSGKGDDVSGSWSSEPPEVGRWRVPEPTGCRIGRGMAFATNALDGGRVHFEDDGGSGPVVVVHGGFGEPIELVRGSPPSGELSTDEFRLVYVDTSAVEP
jgi:hypothetical protein